ALLMQETEARTRPLDFLGTVATRRPMQMAAVAGVALLLSAIPAIVFPERFAALAGRFIAPWNVPPVVVPYAVEVKPGDAVVRRGDAFTVRMNLVKSRDDAVLPDSAVLIVTDPATQKSQRYPMLVDSPTAFSRKLDRVESSLKYHVEAGLAVSGQ